jgi:hybrid cluster-associated redox disulfide protein
MNLGALNSQMTVEEVLEMWPQTAPVFNRYKSACVGCALAPFCTVDDVAATYHFDLNTLMDELHTAATQSGSQV